MIFIGVGRSGGSPVADWGGLVHTVGSLLDHADDPEERSPLPDSCDPDLEQVGMLERQERLTVNPVLLELRSYPGQSLLAKPHCHLVHVPPERPRSRLSARREPLAGCQPPD